MLLWITILVLTAFCLVLIITPLRKQASSMNTDVVQEDQIRRLVELDDDVELGEISLDQEDVVRSEIERQVVDGIDENVLAAGQEQQADVGFTTLWISVVVILIAGTTYAGLGSPELAGIGENHHYSTPKEAFAGNKNTNNSIENIKAQALNNPEDIQNWFLLARTYLHIGQYSNAVEAAEHIVSKTANDTAAELLLVDALAMQAGGRVTQRAIRLVEQVLAREPLQPVALTLKGMAAMQNGETELATEMWQKALANMSVDDPLRLELEPMVKANTPKQPQAIAINVRVSAIQNLVADIAPDTAIFVLARPVNGPKAPLAVVKLTLGDLPATVKLNETMAMLPNHSLANFEKVEVVARLSLSGDPIAKKGDIEGKNGPVETSEGGFINVIIDTIIP
jgi:cytochrome c-type biogenesis protein CcmH